MSAIKRTKIHFLVFIFAGFLIFQPNFWAPQAIVDGNYLIGYSIYGDKAKDAFALSENYSWTRIPEILLNKIFYEVCGPKMGYILLRVLLISLVIFLILRLSKLMASQNISYTLFTLLIFSIPFWSVYGNDYHYGLNTIFLISVYLASAIIIIESNRNLQKFVGFAIGFFWSVIIFSGAGIPFLCSYFASLLTLIRSKLKNLKTWIIFMILGFSSGIIFFSWQSFLIFQNVNPLGVLLKWSYFYSRSGMWSYWNSPGFKWLNFATNLLILPTSILYIFYLRKGLFHKTHKDISNFFRINYFLILIYYLSSQFVLKNTMGLLELGFQVEMLIVLPSIHVGLIIGEELKEIETKKIAKQILIALVFIQIIPRYKFHVLGFGALIFFINLISVKYFKKCKSLNPKRNRNNRIMSNVLFPIYLISASLFYLGNTSHQIPGGANIANPDGNEIIGFNGKYYEEWIMDVQIAKWAFNKKDFPVIHKTKIWLLPKEKNGKLERFSDSQWGAAGTLMWGNAAYSVLGVDSYSDAFLVSLKNQLQAEKVQDLIIVASTRKDLDLAQNMFNKTKLIVLKNVCRSFSTSKNKVFLCKITYWK